MTTSRIRLVYILVIHLWAGCSRSVANQVTMTMQGVIRPSDAIDAFSFIGDLLEGAYQQTMID